MMNRKRNIVGDYLPPLGSFAFGLSLVEPHLLHLFAPGGFLALHFMHMYLLSSLASASGNLMTITISKCLLYLTDRDKSLC